MEKIIAARRGLAFTGGEGPSPAFIRGLIREAPPYLTAAADSGLALAEAAGLRPDWLAGDMDSLDDPRRLDSYPPGRVIRWPAAKDFTDTEIVIALLREKGCGEVWLAGGGGGRLDHLLAIRGLFEREFFPRRWYTAAEEVRCLEGPECLELRRAPESVVSVFPLGAGPWKAVSRGLVWPLDAAVWDRGFSGISNIARKGPFTIEVRSGRFLVITALNVPGM